ncbi:MAG: hypothetical protein Kapaf2KO_08690 [Candidatus Kapaibacteriales bacterium]
MPKVNISITKYSPDLRKKWDDFVETSMNGTMFHKQAFLDYHPGGKFAFNHLVFWEGDDIVAMLPAGVKSNGAILASPVGASYGGFVIQDISFERTLNIVDTFIDYCREQEYEKLYVIPAPAIYNKAITQHIDYALLYRKFKSDLNFISNAIEISPELDPMEYLDKTARKSVRKTLNNDDLRVVLSEDYETFYSILLENKQKHNATPTHSLEDLKRLKELLPENLILYMAYYKEEPIAGTLLFSCNSRVILCFYTMLKYEYEHLKPVYALNYQTMIHAKENGYRWMDFGVSQVPSDPDPMTPALSLIKFKERFGSKGYLRTQYVLELEKASV